MYQSKFQKTLEVDEKVEWSARPQFISTLVMSAVINIPAILLLIIGIAMVRGGSLGGEFVGVYLAAIGAAYLFFALFYSLFIIIACKTNYFALTNKRLIIRHGIFGTYYKSLYIETVGAIDVSVGLINRIFGLGHITFGSSTGGMNMHGFSSHRVFRFTFIKQPYEAQQKLQSRITEMKKNSSKA